VFRILCPRIRNVIIGASVKIMICMNFYLSSSELLYFIPFKILLYVCLNLE